MYFGNFASNPWMFVILIFLIANNISSYINNPSALLGLVLAIPGVIIAMTFHEFAHAWAANKLGDDTPRAQGRLNLNPLSHIDPIGIVLLLFAGFGWGKPVEINSNNFNRKVSIRQGNAIVAAAGPIMNFILAILFSIVYGLIIKFNPSFLVTEAGQIVINMLGSIITMNVGLGVFNLIPLPPLDGSKIIVAFLPKNMRDWFESNEKILYIIFLIIWITPIVQLIVSPLIGAVEKALISLIWIIAG